MNDLLAACGRTRLHDPLLSALGGPALPRPVPAIFLVPVSTLVVL
jgi:hypothetical protein